MKTILIFISLLVATFVNAQVKLTPDNFISVDDNSKNYIVIDVPDKSAHDLYITTKAFINEKYNNPKFVLSEIEDKQIAVDGTAPIEAKALGITSVAWDLRYKYIFDFKDGKVRFQPVFRWLDQTYDDKQINLIGTSVMGIKNGVYSKKGKLFLKNAELGVNKRVNADIETYSSYLNNPESKANEDW